MCLCRIRRHADGRHRGDVRNSNGRLRGDDVRNVGIPLRFHDDGARGIHHDGDDAHALLRGDDGFRDDGAHVRVRGDVLPPRGEACQVPQSIWQMLLLSRS